ncbi:hypothetical protein KIW_07800 [Pediococcus acidilactici MA18/5M]|nr:hypothetical protein KIW_07800 [Pediococcus acidilactici MA18/5M]
MGDLINRKELGFGTRFADGCALISHSGNQIRPLANPT